MIEAMIDKTKAFTIDGEVLNKEAAFSRSPTGRPPRNTVARPSPAPSGTVESLDVLLKQLGYANAARIDIQPSGAEKLGTGSTRSARSCSSSASLASTSNSRRPALACPASSVSWRSRFISSAATVAGLSGAGWILAFALGILLIALELFVFPGISSREFWAHLSCSSRWSWRWWMFIQHALAALAARNYGYRSAT